MYEYRAMLTRVIDADTVELRLDLGFRLSRDPSPYRLARIDAPELATEAGKAARMALLAYLDGKSLLVQTQRADSFGRYICDLYADGTCVNDWLVNDGYASYREY